MSHEDAEAKAAEKAKLDKEKADKLAEEKAEAVQKALEEADKAKAKLDADPSNHAAKKAHEHALEAVAKADEAAAKAAAEADAKAPKQEYLLALVDAVPETILRNGVKIPNPLTETNSVKVCADSVEDAIRQINVGQDRAKTRKMYRVFDCLNNEEVPLVAPVPEPLPVQMVQVVPAVK